MDVNPMIPWHVFLAALKAQSPRDLEEWLPRWRFYDEGVALLSRLPQQQESSLTENDG